MTLSGEADIPQMLQLFESFLQASGYMIEGKELVLKRSAVDFDEFPKRVSSLRVNGEDILAIGK